MTASNEAMVALAGEIEKLKNAFEWNAFCQSNRKRISEAIRLAAAAPATTRPATLHGMITSIYGQLDAEDCAMVDRELAKLRKLNVSSDAPATEVGVREALTDPKIPIDPVKAFAYLVSKCASGLYLELLDAGRTDTTARNQIIFMFLDFAAGEACRVARREGRDPRPDKWATATTDAFERAIKRTAAKEAADEGIALPSTHREGQ